MRDGVKARLDVSVEHPPILLGAVTLDLSDRVVRPPHRPEPIGDRQKVRLEDRFQHELERRLDDPVRDRRYPEFANLPRPTRLGDHAFPHRQRGERARLQLGTQVVQEPRHPDDLLDVGGRQAVHAGRVGASVTRDPAERHEQRRRVVHEVEQVIEPAAWIGCRPTVKLGLHLRYPSPSRSRARCAAIRRRVLRHCSLLPFSIPLPPFPMCRALPGSEYYGGSAPSRADRRSTRPTQRPRRMRGSGQDRDGSRVHCDSLDEGGARLGPCGIATATPQHFTVASRPVVEHQPRSSRPSRTGAHRSRPISTRFEPVRALRDVNAGSLRTPFHPARRTRLIWQC